MSSYILEAVFLFFLFTASAFARRSHCCRGAENMEILFLDINCSDANSENLKCNITQPAFFVAGFPHDISHVHRFGNENIILHHRSSDKCITADTNSVHLSPCTGTQNQIWHEGYYVENGFRDFRSKYLRNMCLEMTETQDIRLNRCDGSNAQLWSHNLGKSAVSVDKYHVRNPSLYNLKYEKCLSPRDGQFLVGEACELYAVGEGIDCSACLCFNPSFNRNCTDCDMYCEIIKEYPVDFSIHSACCEVTTPFDQTRFFDILTSPEQLKDKKSSLCATYNEKQNLFTLADCNQTKAQQFITYPAFDDLVSGGINTKSLLGNTFVSSGGIDSPYDFLYEGIRDEGEIYLGFEDGALRFNYVDSSDQHVVSWSFEEIEYENLNAPDFGRGCSSFTCPDNSLPKKRCVKKSKHCRCRRGYKMKKGKCTQK